MEARSCFILILLVMQAVFSGQWKTSAEENLSVGRKYQKPGSGNPKHYHLPGNQETKKRVATPNTRELRKKPSGHLTALKADDMENDGVVSVAIGPPPARPKYDKSIRKTQNKNTTSISAKANNNNAVNLVKDVLSQLGREFLSHQVNEDFVFGQYVGGSMKNLTSEIKLKMQHDILDIIVKYQKQNKGDVTENYAKQKEEEKSLLATLREIKAEKKATTNNNNETDEPWPDFSNLAKIVG